ncbi:hypothetical protein Y017_11295 [Alcanivorax sp. 97CO-5]|uniref:hypothetical protein n=1 Tax=unclassified Alcanivorax TaxID=2638842 RepID=UPI0003E7EC1B|nr:MULTISPECIES: hypothetical protein [unclassified Alcanivorax]EUC70002.1 hypothetical protein Y017_11295 [Alcanivorax sp. 97CO-5]PKG01784.1 hypothetical protein Y019_06195 [Alcanivorax sp. 97CO-6]
MNNLREFLPRVTAWAKKHHDLIQVEGVELNDAGADMARSVGVEDPNRIRVMLVDEIPFREDPVIYRIAKSVGMFSGQVMGITFGHSIYIVKGCESAQLFSHEFRHVYQYETLGSIQDFMEVYLEQVLEFSYDKAPLELDARQFEITEPL